MYDNFNESNDLNPFKAGQRITASAITKMAGKNDKCYFQLSFVEKLSNGNNRYLPLTRSQSIGGRNGVYFKTLRSVKDRQTNAPKNALYLEFYDPSLALHTPVKDEHGNYFIKTRTGDKSPRAYSWEELEAKRKNKEYYEVFFDRNFDKPVFTSLSLTMSYSILGQDLIIKMFDLLGDNDNNDNQLMENERVIINFSVVKDKDNNVRYSNQNGTTVPLHNLYLSVLNDTTGEKRQGKTVLSLNQTWEIPESWKEMNDKMNDTFTRAKELGAISAGMKKFFDTAVNEKLTLAAESRLDTVVLPSMKFRREADGNYQDGNIRYKYISLENENSVHDNVTTDEDNNPSMQTPFDESNEDNFVTENETNEGVDEQTDNADGEDLPF